MIGRRLARIVVAAGAGMAALGLAGCGERPQVIEYKQGQAWRKVSITGLVFWRYFSKRTQHIYQNETLPVTKLPA